MPALHPTLTEICKASKNKDLQTDIQADQDRWHLNCYSPELLGLLPIKKSLVDLRSGSSNERFIR